VQNIMRIFNVINFADRIH